GPGIVVVIELLFRERRCDTEGPDAQRAGSSGRATGTWRYQVRVAPVSSFVPRWRHLGSLSTVRPVTRRRLRITDPYISDAVLDSFPPGVSSMKGMNLSGTRGIVHPMQMPPTFGQPPIPLIQPRLGTLHFTTGPQQPSLTMHFGDPYSVAKSPCS